MLSVLILMLILFGTSTFNLKNHEETMIKFLQSLNV